MALPLIPIVLGGGILFALTRASSDKSQSGAAAPQSSAAGGATRLNPTGVPITRQTIVAGAVSSAPPEPTRATPDTGSNIQDLVSPSGPVSSPPATSADNPVGSPSLSVPQAISLAARATTRTRQQPIAPTPVRGSEREGQPPGQIEPTVEQQAASQERAEDARENPDVTRGGGVPVSVPDTDAIIIESVRLQGPETRVVTPPLPPPVRTAPSAPSLVVAREVTRAQPQVISAGAPIPDASGSVPAVQTAVVARRTSPTLIDQRLSSFSTFSARGFVF